MSTGWNTLGEVPSYARPSKEIGFFTGIFGSGFSWKAGTCGKIKTDGTIQIYSQEQRTGIVRLPIIFTYHLS